MIDNYDSFTYNLVQYLQELNTNVVVFRNDKITLNEIEQMQPEKIIISPGPGQPEDAGITLNVIKHFAGIIPILGVCLGHQSISHTFGARIIQAKKIMHGKTSMIFHNNNGVFRHLTNPIQATRYHSLVIDQNTLSADFEITAWTQTNDGRLDEIMGIKHRKWRLEGVQFHPESILSQEGHALLQNFISNT